MKKSLITILIVLGFNVHLTHAAISVVQSVSSSVNALTAITQTITSTTAGNLLLVNVEMTNGAVGLSVSTTGTAQTFTTIANATGAAGQLQSWYASNIAAGTTAVTVTRSAGSGQFSIIVTEVSGIATVSPLDKTVTNFGQSVSPLDTLTTAATTQASEFWWAGFGMLGPTDGTSPVFSTISSPWTEGSKSSSNIGGANANTGAYTGYQIVSNTGTANATVAVSTIGGSGNVSGQAFIATFKGTVTASVPLFPRMIMMGQAFFMGLHFF